MDFKRKSSDPYEVVIKMEPDVVSGLAEENDCSTKQAPFKNLVKNDLNVLGFGDTDNNNCEYQAIGYFINLSEIKEEIDECVVPKIENQLTDFPEKIDNGSIKFDSATVKKEFDFHDVVDINETRLEVSESEYIQAKIERELLTTYCDLQTLKNESTGYSDIILQPSSSKYAGRTLKTTTNITSDIKKKLQPSLVCQKTFRSSKTFPTKINLNDHLKIHADNKLFKCQICSKWIDNLETHLQSHFEEESFKCEICWKRFTQKDTFNLHLKNHFVEKLFKCEICLKWFKRKGSLKLHLKIHTGEKPFKCEICSKSFTKKGNFKRHLRIHPGEKPFKCEVCLISFTQKSQLKNHLRIHIEDKPIKCEACSKPFIEVDNLKMHLRIYSGKKTFKCEVCSKRFTRLLASCSV